MIKYRSAVAALATLALAGTTLATAAPAIAAGKTVVSDTITIVYGNGKGKDCQLAGVGPVQDGTTVSSTRVYSDGSTSTQSDKCQNGSWVSARLSPISGILTVPVSAGIYAPAS